MSDLPFDVQKYIDYYGIYPKERPDELMVSGEKMAQYILEERMCKWEEIPENCIGYGFLTNCDEWEQEQTEYCPNCGRKVRVT